VERSWVSHSGPDPNYRDRRGMAPGFAAPSTRRERATLCVSEGAPPATPAVVASATIPI
jgi:hypothetical protein